MGTLHFAGEETKAQTEVQSLVQGRFASNWQRQDKNYFSESSPEVCPLSHRTWGVASEKGFLDHVKLPLLQTMDFSCSLVSLYPTDFWLLGILLALAKDQRASKYHSPIPYLLLP